MRFLFITDIHGRANNPVSRKDNFPETVLKKLSWAVDTANKNDAAIICGGDWLQRPDTSPNFIAKMAEILMKARKGVYSVIGNHDMYSYNIESFKRTPLYLLFACGIIQELTNKPTVFYEHKEIPEAVALFGASSNQYMDKNGRVCDYIITGDDHDNFMDEVVWTRTAEATGKVTVIHTVHGFLADKAWPKEVPHTLIDSVCENNFADIILTGHEHSGYNVIEKVCGGHKIVFCNPGSLSRVTAGVGDMRETVQAALIDTLDEDNKVTLIECDIAYPANDVLDRDRLLEEKSRQKTIEAFSTKLSDIKRDFVIDEKKTEDAVGMLMSFMEEIKDSELASYATDEVLKLCQLLLTSAEEQISQSREARRADD